MGFTAYNNFAWFVKFDTGYTSSISLEVVNLVQTDFVNDGEGDACDYDDGIGIDEISEDTPTLIKMIDVQGREQQELKIGTLLFYIYDNGKVEKKVIH